MSIEMPTKTRLEKMLGKNILNIWDRLIECIDQLYDVDRIWNKGFGDWVYEYKYRRGGKTLCTLYAKADIASVLLCCD